MSEFASRVHQQVQPLHIERNRWIAHHRRTVFLLLFLVIVLVASATQTDVSFWWGASVGSIYATAITTLSTETEVVVAGAISGGNIPAAIRAVKSEKENVQAEQKTFEEFAEEVQSLSTVSQSAMGTNAQTVNTGANNRVLGRVRETYRETVMSTPDFDCEYGESFHEHVAAEFGDDVASLLIEGHQLNEPIKRLLVQQSRQSAQQRKLLREGLTVEERSLEDAQSALQPVQGFLNDVERTNLSEQSLSSLVTLDTQVRAHREHCEDLVDTRQQQIHTVNRRMNGESKTLTQEYLYRDLSVSFPVLTATLNRMNSLDDVRSEIITAVSQPH